MIYFSLPHKPLRVLLYEPFEHTISVWEGMIEAGFYERMLKAGYP